MIKKTLAAWLTLSIAMLTGLTACGKNNDSSAAASNNGMQVEAGFHESATWISFWSGWESMAGGDVRATNSS